MNNGNPSVSRLALLYRRCTRAHLGQPLPDVDTLLALADGERSADTERLVADVGRSGVHADLLRFARALAPESARLGVQLDQAFDRVAAGHRRGGRGARRAVAHPARLRFIASLAAGVIVAVAVWGLQQRQAAAPAELRSAAVAQPAHDRIFAALDDRATPRDGDRIFRAAFTPDRIFKGRFSGG